MKNKGRLVCAVDIASRHENVKSGSWQLLSVMKARENCEQTAVFCPWREVQIKICALLFRYTFISSLLWFLSVTLEYYSVFKIRLQRNRLPYAIFTRASFWSRVLCSSSAALCPVPMLAFCSQHSSFYFNSSCILLPSPPCFFKASYFPIWWAS